MMSIEQLFGRQLADRAAARRAASLPAAPSQVGSRETAQTQKGGQGKPSLALVWPTMSDGLTKRGVLERRCTWA